MLRSIPGSATPCVRPEQRLVHFTAVVAPRAVRICVPGFSPRREGSLNFNHGLITAASYFNAVAPVRGIRSLRSTLPQNPHTNTRVYRTISQRISTGNFRQLTVSAALSPPNLKEKKDRPKLAVFVSGGGSNFRAIHAAILDGRIKADVAVLISDSPGCGGWQYAEQHGIPCIAYPTPVTEHAAMTREYLVHNLRHMYAVDYIVLAGYLKLIPEPVVSAYKRAILNIHPALLPAFGGKGFYGKRVHKAVIASGARYTGATVHFIDEKYDTGPILAQRVVRVYPTDTPETLAARVLEQEHQLYPEAVAALVDGRVTWREDGVPILWTNK